MKKNVTLILLGLAILIILFVVMEFRPEIYMPLERFLYDKREFFEIDLTQEKKEINIVDIDAKSVKELGRYHNWPRYYFGKAINVVSRQRPYVIGLDMIFSTPDSLNDFAKKVYIEKLTANLKSLFPSEDSSKLKENLEKSLSALSFDDYIATQIKKAGNVVLASYLNTDTTNVESIDISKYFLSKIDPPNNPELTFDGITMPIPAYLKAGAKIGMVNDIFDPDGVRRKDPLFFNYKNKTLPSFSLAIATRAVKNWNYSNGKLEILNRQIPLEDGVFLRIKYQGDAKTFRYVSFVDVVKENLPDTLFTKKIVLFGSSLPELYDYSQTPFGAKLPGVECHANIIHNLLFSNPITKPPKYIVILISIFLIFITLLLANKTAPYISPIITFIITIIYLLFTILMYMSYFVSYEMSRPVIGIIFAFLAGLISRIYFGEEEKKWMKDLFSRYVSEEVVNQIMVSPHINLEGKRQEISILFCDVRSFTPRTEKEKPENIVKILNAYFEEMSNTIFQFGGMVDKYLGDGIMA
jgi:adenylate cyclase